MKDQHRLILTILQDHPAGLFGLEIIDASDGKLSRGSIYIHLADLEAEELVTSEREPAAVGLPRPKYRITRKGRRVLDEQTGHALTVNP